jgi:hypothetical protein
LDALPCRGCSEGHDGGGPCRDEHIIATHPTACRDSALRLFGSKARGDATKETDIDVLVVVNEFGRDVERKMSDAAFQELCYG